MRSVNILLVSFMFFALLSCQMSKINQNDKKVKTENKQEKYLKTRELAALWYRYSAEKEALYYQAYNWAKIALDRNLANQQSLHIGNKPAVVLDIDETVLDNIPQQLKLLKSAQPYTKESWVEWVKQAKAKPLPGSLEFTRYAKSKGVEVFYVSNRYAENLSYTINNLKKYNYPNADNEHILLRGESSDKTKRRELISKKYNVILLLGDNLRDFSEEFAKRDKESMGTKVVEKYKDLFGKLYIVFPNPTYGEWEKALYNNSYKWTEEQRDSIRKLLIEPGY